MTKAIKTGIVEEMCGGHIYDTNFDTLINCYQNENSIDPLLFHGNAIASKYFCKFTISHLFV
jgi:hypothetical protein